MKIFVKSLIIFITTFCLFGCSHKTNNQTELTFWTLQLNDFSPFMEKMINEYEKKHPTIKIKWVDVPFSEGEKRTLSAVMSKNVPDVINLNPSFAATLQQKNVLYIIDDNLEKTYLKSALQLCKNNDKYFAIPWYLTSKITIYNKDLLKGTGYKNIPTTYNKILPFAFVIKRNLNKYAFMPNLAEDGAMLKIMAKQNVKVNDFFTNKKTAEMYKVFKKLYTYNLIPKGSINQKHRESLEKHMAGETVFLESGANFLKTIKQNAPDIYKKTQVSPQLEIQNDVISISLMNLIIPNKSKHKKEALAFAKFITNPENQLKFCKIAPVLPSTRVTLDDDFFQRDKTLIDKGRKISAQQLKTAKKTQPILSNKKKINEIVDYTTQSIILDKKSIEEALKEGQKLFNTL